MANSNMSITYKKTMRLGAQQSSQIGWLNHEAEVGISPHLGSTAEAAEQHLSLVGSYSFLH